MIETSLTWILSRRRPEPSNIACVLEQWAVRRALVAKCTIWWHYCDISRYIAILVLHNTSVKRVFVGKEGSSKLTFFAGVSPPLEILFGFFLDNRYELAEPCKARLDHFLLLEKYLHTARGAVVTDHSIPASRLPEVYILT